MYHVTPQMMEQFNSRWPAATRRFISNGGKFRMTQYMILIHKISQICMQEPIMFQSMILPDVNSQSRILFQAQIP